MRKEKMEWLLHWNMSMIGGFLGGYAILVRGGHFGSAQTANMIVLVIDLLQQNLTEALIRAGAVLLYIASLVAAFLIPRYRKRDFRRGCILLELFGVAAIGFLPADLPNLIALYPIFAVTAFQWGTFCGIKEYNSATIFSTNNLRQAVLALAEYIRTKELMQKEKFTFYGGTLLSFHIGVAISVLAVYYWNIRGVWVSIAPLLSAYVIHCITAGQDDKNIEADN